MKTLEEQIRNKRDQFDVDEPGEGHLDRFERKLERSVLYRKQKPFFIRPQFIRIAATVLLIAGLGSLIVAYKTGLFNINVGKNISSSKLPVELLEVARYYSVVTNKKISMLEKAAPNQQEGDRIRQNAQEELDALDNTAKELHEEYRKNSNDQRIYAALVEIEKKKSEILDKMINSIN